MGIKYKLTVIFSALLLLAGCSSSSAEAIFQPDYPVENYVDIIDRAVLTDILNENVDVSQNIEICYPVYVLDFDVNNLSVGQQLFFPWDTVVFPVLENKNPVGYIRYCVGGKDIGEPQFFEMPAKAAEKLLSGHSIKVAQAQWAVYDGYAEFATDYMYISDDNKTGALFQYYPDRDIFDYPKVNYKNAVGLFEIDGNFEVIMQIQTKENLP